MARQVNQPGALNVVVLEDVHWADEASIDLLRYLGRRLRGAAVLLVVTYRDDELSATDPLRRALGQLATQRTTRRINLAPLSIDAVRVLAAGSGLEPGELYRLTSGNPFFVTEVIQAGIDEVPRSARDAVLARVARLSDPAREALELAALMGTRTELRVLTSANASTPAIFDELLASGLLVDDGAWLRFRHEIARLAVEGAVPAHRRVGMHARVSRKWTGKMLTVHKADRRSAVRMVLEAAGVDPGEADRYSATQTCDDGTPRYAWLPVDYDDFPTYIAVIAASVAQRQRWRTQYEKAKQRAGPQFGNSATNPAA